MRTNCSVCDCLVDVVIANADGDHSSFEECIQAQKQVIGERNAMIDAFREKTGSLRKATLEDLLVEIERRWPVCHVTFSGRSTAGPGSAK